MSPPAPVDLIISFVFIDVTDSEKLHNFSTVTELIKQLEAEAHGVFKSMFRYSTMV